MATSFHRASSFSIGSPSPCSMACWPRSGNAQPRSPPGVTLVRWTPPRFGWTKLNFDGSVLHDGSGRASIGGVIRDANGRVVLSFAERTEHAPIGIVEARALIRGLKLALDYGCDRLVVEGDDLTLVKLLRCESTQTRIPHEMLDEIIWLLDSFDVCEVQHNYREGNSVADAMCREAYKTTVPRLLIGMVPHPLWEKVAEDRRGVVHERVRA